MCGPGQAAVNLVSRRTASWLDTRTLTVITLGCRVNNILASHNIGITTVYWQKIDNQSDIKLTFNYGHFLQESVRKYQGISKMLNYYLLSVQWMCTLGTLTRTTPVSLAHSLLHNLFTFSSCHQQSCSSSSREVISWRGLVSLSPAVPGHCSMSLSHLYSTVIYQECVMMAGV